VKGKRSVVREDQSYARVIIHLPIQKNNSEIERKNSGQPLGDEIDTRGNHLGSVFFPGGGGGGVTGGVEGQVERKRFDLYYWPFGGTSQKHEGEDRYIYPRKKAFAT